MDKKELRELIIKKIVDIILVIQGVHALFFFIFGYGLILTAFIKDFPVIDFAILLSSGTANITFGYILTKNKEGL